MAHDDQFTSTGPPLAGSGVRFSAFSSRATRMVYGLNVQGDRAGSYSESVRAETGRESEVEGVGACGVGDNFGVFGSAIQSPGRRGIAGVYGQHKRGGVGAIGVAMRGGVGVAGVSFKTLGNPVLAFQSLPDPADGDGTGVLGTSGSGAGVLGTSNVWTGVLGRSSSNAGVRAESDTGDALFSTSRTFRGGVFESATDSSALVAQIRLVPKPMAVPDVVPAAPVMFDTRVSDSLPREGRGGDLLATDGDDGVSTLWFCVRGQEGERAATWSQVLLGLPMVAGAASRNESSMDVATRLEIHGTTPF